MRKSWLLCVLLGTLAWGQRDRAAATASAGNPEAPGETVKAPAPEAASNHREAVSAQSKGVCAPAVKSTAASKTAEAKQSGTTAKNPADCETNDYQAEFEKIASALSPKLTPQLKKQLEACCPGSWQCQMRRSEGTG